MTLEKEKINMQIKELMREIRSKYLKEQSMPTDKEIYRLANMFYKRDKDHPDNHDFEMMAVQRGIIQGMGLLRQIIEGYNL